MSTPNHCTQCEGFLEPRTIIRQQPWAKRNKSYIERQNLTMRMSMRPSWAGRNHIWVHGGWR